MTEKTILRARGRSVKVIATKSFHDIVLLAAHEMMKETVNMTRVPTKRDQARLRNLLEPAYKCIAASLNELVPSPHFKYESSHLSGIKVEMRPTIGIYDITVQATVEDSQYITKKSFTLKVYSADGSNLFLRTSRTRLIEAGKDRLEEACRLHDTL